MTSAPSMKSPNNDQTLTKHAREKLIAVIDTPELDRACDLIKATMGHVGCYKFGLEFCYANGLHVINDIKDKVGDFDVFLDLKMHDIPNQIEGAVRSCVSQLKPKFLTVHISGGKDMLIRAMDAKNEINPATNILGVSVLTSLDQQNLVEIGQLGTPAKQVLNLANLAVAAGLDGLVSSAQELSVLKEIELVKVTPGIRLNETDEVHGAHDDQKRVMSPFDAVKHGANYLVVGRSISQSTDPAYAADMIVNQIETALNS